MLYEYEFPVNTLIRDNKKKLLELNQNISNKIKARDLYLKYSRFCFREKRKK